ncbi:TetR family transcriptional regulator [Octadecabacter antarcticus 307]|uniref:TetR family transcriptional regulator n=1 Tax=Octadecabacter antarcticus 307 TaxID=391626 RepID=M9RAK6_9RHOB|nr:TetR/AcrR family transcriptional regulator [Octadecabacter antarcticus]AGI69684.1 TetR family transcriptional regulator [Octadecabacter antarcticus 307]
MATEADKQKSEKTPRTRSKQERKRQLIDATITSIAKYGIPGTTMTTVTSIAGLSLGLVNFHFESKQKLFEETLLHLALEDQEMWRKAIEGKGLSAEEKILAIVDAHFHPKVGSRKKQAVWFAFYGDSTSRAAYRRIGGDIDDARYDCLLALLNDLKNSGDFPHVNTTDVATIMESLFDGLSLTMLIYPGDTTRDDAKRQMRSYLAATFPNRFTPPEIAT